MPNIIKTLNIQQYFDEVRVDVSSALGAYSGTFVMPKRGWQQLNKLNKDKNFPVYFHRQANKHKTNS